MPEIIMSFDPGRTTGLAVYEEDPTPNYTLMELKGLHTVWKALFTGGPTQIVYESFLYQRRTKVDLTPVEVIGIIKLYAETYEVPIVSQTPATGKRFWTDSKIKKVGLWQSGAPHAMDALRHMLYYQAFNLMDKSKLEALKDDTL